MITPMPLVIFQLKAKIERKTSNSIRNNIEMEHPTPSDETVTGSWRTNVYISQGKGNLKKNIDKLDSPSDNMGFY